MTQTDGPVQLDQVLTSLQSDTRDEPPEPAQGLRRRALRRPGAGRGRRPGPGHRGRARRRVAQRLARRTRAEALQGHGAREPGAARHRAARPVEADRRARRRRRPSSSRSEDALKDLVTNFNRTTAAFAARAGQPAPDDRAAAAGARARPTRRSTRSTRSFPPTRAFAREILPGVRETPATIDASFPWIAQTRALVSPAELQGLVGDLRPAVADLSAVTDDSIELLPQVDLVSRCFIDVVLPTGDIEDRGRLPHHRHRELQGVLADDGRALGRVAELRRQRLATRASRPAAARTRVDRPVGTGTRAATAQPLFGNSTPRRSARARRARPPSRRSTATKAVPHATRRRTSTRREVGGGP